MDLLLSLLAQWAKPQLNQSHFSSFIKEREKLIDEFGGAVGYGRGRPAIAPFNQIKII